jgi:hypothetical protein
MQQAFTHMISDTMFDKLLLAPMLLVLQASTTDTNPDKQKPPYAKTAIHFATMACAHTL